LSNMTPERKQKIEQHDTTEKTKDWVTCNPLKILGVTRKNCFRYLKLMSPLKNNYLTLRSKVRVPWRTSFAEKKRKKKWKWKKKKKKSD
jgi:hypothetical protein